MKNSTQKLVLERFEAEALPHLDACYGLALRLTRNKHDAHDLVQEAYLRAFRYFHRYEQGTNFKAWIFKILRNVFLNNVRKKAVVNESYDTDNLEFIHERMVAREGISSNSDPEIIAMELQAKEMLLEALDELPEVFRTVVHLCDIEGCSYQEIASIVGCPIGTVMSRLHRGRQLLKQTLAHDRTEIDDEVSSQERRHARDDQLKAVASF